MNVVTTRAHWAPEAQIIGEALNGLRRSTGIIGELLQAKAGSADEVSLRVADTRLQYVCAIKRNVDRLTLLDDIKARAPLDRNTLLVCTPLTTTMAARCNELGIQFIDTAGNAYLTNGAGILINVTGRKEHESSLRPDKTITPAALKMMFAFLAQPSMLNAPYRDISAAVHVATGAIGKALAAMEHRGFIGTTPRGRRIIHSPELMLSEWATGYTGRIKPKLKTFRFSAVSPTDFIAAWTPEMRRSAWGGEVAAAKMTQHLNPATATLYLDSGNIGAVPEMVKRFRLRGDPNGAIEIVQAFWNMDFISENFPTVPLHLIYADLLGTNDPRNLLVAKQIYQQVIDHVHHSGK